jgi:hypothetical protein
VRHDIHEAVSSKAPAPKSLGRFERTVLKLLMRVTALLMARRLGKALRRGNR